MMLQGICKRKHRTLSLQEKSVILNRLDSGEIASQLAREFDVGKATIYDIKKRSDKIRSFISSTYTKPDKRQTLKRAENPLVEDGLYDWFLEQRTNHIYVSGDMLAAKAKELYKRITKKDDFAGTKGWLDRFKSRHGIKLKGSAEMAEMHYMYGLADGNGEKARRIYHQRYPNRALPDSRTFANIHQRLVETSSSEEVHLKLPKDMVNYMEYHIMGTVSQVRMTPGCTPSKFECQEDRRKRTCHSTERPYFLKKQRMMTIAECLSEPGESSTPSSSLKDTADTSSRNEPLDSLRMKKVAEKCGSDSTSIKRLKKTEISKPCFEHTSSQTSTSQDKLDGSTSTWGVRVKTHLPEYVKNIHQNTSLEISREKQLNLSQTETFHLKDEAIEIKTENEINFPSISTDTNLSGTGPAGVFPEITDATERSRKAVKVHENDKLFCRICLQQVAKNSFIPLFTQTDESGQLELRMTEQVKLCQDVIRILIPEFDYSITFNPIMCMACHTRLMTAYDFIKECRTNEKFLKQYKEEYAPTKKFVSINEVVRSKNKAVNKSRKRKEQLEREDIVEQLRYAVSVLKPEPEDVEIDGPEHIEIDEKFIDQLTSSVENKNASLIRCSEMELSEDSSEVKTECEIFDENLTVKEECDYQEFPTTELIVECQDPSTSSYSRVSEEIINEISSNTTSYGSSNFIQYPQNVQKHSLLRTHSSFTNISTINVNLKNIHDNS